MTWEPDYVTVAELKSYLRVDDAADDVLLAIHVTTASRAVDGYCARQFGQVASLETREYSGVWDRHVGCYVVEIDDIQEVDDLVVIGPDAQVITDYDLGPTNAILKGKPYERILTTVPGTLTVDGMWGWTAVPVPVKNATLLQAARLAARRDSPFGIAGSPTEQSEIRLLASLDPDLRTSLNRYRRMWWAA